MAGALKTWDGSQWVTIGGNADQTTHTGEVTGDTALTVNPGGTVTVATDDLVLVQDVSDSNSLQRVTAQSIADLGGGFGLGAGLSTSRMASTLSRSLVMRVGTSLTTANVDSRKPKAILGWVEACTPSTMSIDVTIASGAGSGGYIFLANPLAADGLPGTIAASWGPFDTSAVGIVTLTGLSTAIPASGLYWVGWWHVVAAGGNPNIRVVNQTAALSFTELIPMTSGTRSAIVTPTTQATSPADLSGVTDWSSDQYFGTPLVMIT